METPSAGAEPISSVQVNEARRARGSLAFYLHRDSQKKKPRLGGAGAEYRDDYALTLGPGDCGAHIQDYLGRAVAGGAVVDA
jgi:hypothetical protein